jgi:hypothetical protein
MRRVVALIALLSMGFVAQAYACTAGKTGAFKDLNDLLEGNIIISKKEHAGGERGGYTVEKLEDGSFKYNEYEGTVQLGDQGDWHHLSRCEDLVYTQEVNKEGKTVEVAVEYEVGRKNCIDRLTKESGLLIGSYQTLREAIRDERYRCSKENVEGFELDEPMFGFEEEGF